MTHRDELADAIEYVLPLDIGEDTRRREIAQLAANSAMSRGWRPPARVVSTVEELEALPEGSVVIDPHGYVWRHHKSDWWRAAQDDHPWPSEMLLVDDDSEPVSVTVLHEGGDGS